MIPCICIDDKNRPAEIPVDKWVKEKSKYNIIYIYWHPVQKIQGVDLAEIELDESCKPYGTFAIKRFAISVKDLENFIALCKACTGMNDVDVQEVIKELTVEEELV